MNTININGFDSVISYDPEINMFRGELVGINGGADFYASTVEGLRQEGEISLQAFLDMCAEDGVEPGKASQAHDEWFRQQVEQANAKADDPKTVFTPHDQVLKRFAQKRGHAG